jgi:DNA repair protein RadD
MREHRAVVLVRPCGSGKGTIASYVVHSAESRGKRVIFMVDRRVLVHDMSMRLDRLGIDHGVIMGDDKRRKPWLGTHVASIDTLTRRDVLPVADLIIIDETHKAVSPKWRKVLDRYPNAKILGLTATPIRLDGRGLEEIYDDMVVGPSVEDLLRLKLIVPSVVFAPPRGINTSKVKKTGGDFNNAALAHVCDNAKLVGDIATHWQKHASDRKTAFFGVDCKHARNTAEQFRCAGVETAYVDADTPDDERQKIWDDFDRGTCRIICSVGVIGIGWDHSICSCVIDACPTLSIERFLQRIGRGSRTHPGKTNFLILDHAGNTHRHGFYEDQRVWNLHGKALKEPEEKVESPYTCVVCRAVFRRGPLNCPYCGAAVVVQHRDIKVVKGELEELHRTQTAEKWQKIPLDKQEVMYRKFVLIGQQRGYSVKWAPVRFKAMFGRWPDFEQRKMEAYA